MPLLLGVVLVALEEEEGGDFICRLGGGVLLVFRASLTGEGDTDPPTELLELALVTEEAATGGA